MLPFGGQFAGFQQRHYVIVWKSQGFRGLLRGDVLAQGIEQDRLVVCEKVRDAAKNVEQGRRELQILFIGRNQPRRTVRHRRSCVCDSPGGYSLVFRSDHRIHLILVGARDVVGDGGHDGYSCRDRLTNSNAGVPEMVAIPVQAFRTVSALCG